MCDPKREVDDGHPYKTRKREIMVESSDGMNEFMADEALLIS